MLVMLRSVWTNDIDDVFVLASLNQASLENGHSGMCPVARYVFHCRTCGMRIKTTAHMSRWALGSDHGWCWHRSCFWIWVMSDSLANFLYTVAAWNWFLISPTTNWRGPTRNASALRCSVCEMRWKPTRTQTRQEDTDGMAMKETAGRSGAWGQWHRCL